MTLPESPVQDTDRLRELIDLGAAKLRAEAKGQHVSYPDVMRIALAAVLPVHREMVLDEAAQSIINHMDEHFPADGNDVQRRARRHLRIAVRVVSPNPTQEQLAEKLVEMGVLRRVEDDPWQRRAAATGGGPCPGCGRSFWTHVCLSCSPDSQSPGPGCINCRQTGMDQTPCKPAAVGPTYPPGSPPADERAAPGETGTGESPNDPDVPLTGEALALAEHFRYLDCGVVVDAVDPEDCGGMAVEVLRFLEARGWTPAAAVPGKGDDPAARERLTADISRDLRAFAQDMRVEHRNTDAVLLTEAADKLDGLIALLAAAETERDGLRQHILDIDAHATPYGDIPDEPAWVGTYLVTAGALHRALGRIGHSAPKCEAEAELTKVLEELDLTRQGVDAIQELRRAAEAQVLRLAETIRKVREIHSPPPGWEREWKDPAKALAQGWPPCAGCATVATFTPIGKCRTLAALGDIPSPTAPEASVLSQLDGAMHSIWLHGNWRWLTKNMTTPEKEATLAAVLRHDRAMKADEADLGGELLTEADWAWWREPAPVEPEGTPDADA